MRENNSPESLKKLLESTEPEYLQQSLLHALPEATDVQLSALATLLASVSKAGSSPKHCVRCHKKFYENRNAQDSCRIEHDGREDGERTEIGDDATTMVEACCGLEYDGDDGCPTQFCIIAAHTTDPEEVEYYDSDEEGNQNVVTCKEKGCTKKKRKAPPKRNGSNSRTKKKQK
ncbi:hypothetical protein BV22DRAFT_1028891 [Leucogyrophana mollusca]|uniref:Uncharacterized protein n=1 Tax=Leucogyrophana mollusca TaxID=85980 RepID=A0ACB8BXY1_9AGAM|nr:hypothetical protein BV22DRAFT_1028891 [Leucogyrophana mollusca]